MKNEFIQTENVARFEDTCRELTDPAGKIGPSMAMTTGPTGRGKSEASKRFATQTDAIYIPPFNKITPGMLLREITFELAKVKPARIEKCVEIICDEMARDRRLIILDEADLWPIQLLEMARNLNERADCPIMLVGEDELKAKIGSRRRLANRIRRHVAFAAVKQPEIVLYFKKNIGIDLIPEAAAVLSRGVKGSWRMVLLAAIGMENAMRASSLTEAPLELVKEIVNGLP